MILDARAIAELQHFLMDTAKRSGVSTAVSAAGAQERLASAAALDYVLLIASLHAEDVLNDGAATSVSVRDTLGRAARAALDVVEAVLTAPDEAFDDFVGRHAGERSVFALVRDLLSRGLIDDGNVAFRNLTLATEVRERCRRRLT